MTPEDRKIWLSREEERLITYQHQHRGLSFMKLLLPRTTSRKVNLLGLDNHIYRGSIPKVREDQLPPDVDEKSINEKALYEEIRDMNFPPVPPQEPLGPSRRIGGPYTLTKKLSLAPVKVDCQEQEEIEILGKDGGIYKGTTKYASKLELDKQLRGTKKPIVKVRQPSSSRGFVEPSVILLQTNGKPLKSRRGQKSLVELPAASVGKIIELVSSQNKRRRKRDMPLVKDATVIKDKAGFDRIPGKDETNSAETQKSKDMDESEGMKNVEESENTKEMDEFGNTKGSDETENTEDTAVSESTKDTEEFMSAEDAEKSKRAEDAEEPESTKYSEEFESTKDGEPKSTTEQKSTKDAEESKDTEGPESIKGTEESEDTEELESTKDTGESEDTEELESTSGESEDTEEPESTKDTEESESTKDTEESESIKDTEEVGKVEEPQTETDVSESSD